MNCHSHSCQNHWKNGEGEKTTFRRLTNCVASATKDLKQQDVMQ